MEEFDAADKPGDERRLRSLVNLIRRTDLFDSALVHHDYTARDFHFDQIKKGDKISAVYSEAIAISVKTPEKKK